MEDFIAVLVLYKLKLSDSKTFISLSRSLKKADQHLDIIVYDNTPDYNSDLVSKTEVNSNCTIIYCADYDNSGVSKAYNKGMHIGLEKNKKWLILLDQDTELPESSIRKYLDSINQYPDYRLFAPIMVVKQKKIISPCTFKFMRGFSRTHINVGVNSLARLSVINCGLCIDIESFKKNNGYNELIKLDFSDHDFIARFKKNITDQFIVVDLVVNHELSSAMRNTLDSDSVRFDYYLEGAREMSASNLDKPFIKLNVALRSTKLSLMHNNLFFLVKFFKWISQ